MGEANAAIAGKRGYWLRQLADCAEPDFAALLVTLGQYGGGNVALMPKVMDGTAWVGSYDRKTPIRSVADLTVLQGQCAAVGVSLVPVVVPRGQDGEDLLHAAVAEQCASLIVDVEIGAGFYDHKPPSNIPWYWYNLRVAAPTAHLVSQPDPRNLVTVYDSDSQPYFDGYACQHYVGWHDVGWDDVVTEVERFDAIAATGKPCYPILFGTGVAREVRTFWRAIRDSCQGVSFFALGSMGPSGFELARSCKLPGEPLG